MPIGRYRSKKGKKGEMPKPKTARQIQIEYLDDVFRAVIRLRDQVCQKDGRNRHDATLQVCHIFSRGNFNTRWDPENAILLCSGYHLRFGIAQDNFTDWLIQEKKWITQQAYDNLRTRSKMSSNRHHWQFIGIALEQEKKRLIAVLGERNHWREYEK